MKKVIIFCLLILSFSSQAEPLFGIQLGAECKKFEEKILSVGAIKKIEPPDYVYYEWLNKGNINEIVSYCTKEKFDGFMLTARFELKAEAINHHIYLTELLTETLGQPEKDGTVMFNLLASNKATTHMATEFIKYLKSWEQTGQTINIQSDIDSWISLYQFRKRN